MPIAPPTRNPRPLHPFTLRPPAPCPVHPRLIRLQRPRAVRHLQPRSPQVLAHPQPSASSRQPVGLTRLPSVADLSAVRRGGQTPLVQRRRPQVRASSPSVFRAPPPIPSHPLPSPPLPSAPPSALGPGAVGCGRVGRVVQGEQAASDDTRHPRFHLQSPSPGPTSPLSPPARLPPPQRPLPGPTSPKNNPAALPSTPAYPPTRPASPP